MVVGSIVALLVMGLIVGVVARILVPGREPGGLIVTAIIGTLGFNLYTFVVGLVGAVILLGLYHLAAGPRSYRSGNRGGYRNRSRPYRRRRWWLT